MICFVSVVFYCMNEKELVEAANSILHDVPCEDVILLSGRPVAPIPKLRPPDVTEVSHIQFILVKLVKNINERAHTITFSLKQAEESATDTSVKIKEKCLTSEKTEKLVMEEEQSSDHSHVEDTTYVSETDLNITELETLPYACSPPQQRPVGQRSGPVRDCNHLLDGELEKEGNAQMAAEAEEEDEDGFQLVREIFFR